MSLYVFVSFNDNQVKHFYFAGGEPFPTGFDIRFTVQRMTASNPLLTRILSVAYVDFTIGNAVTFGPKRTRETNFESAL